MVSLPISTPRRGAPEGNKNAFKHGFYSRWFTRQEHQRLDGDALGKLQDEENSLSILIDRVFASFKSVEMTNEKYLAAARTVALAVGRIDPLSFCLFLFDLLNFDSGLFFHLYWRSIQ